MNPQGSKLPLQGKTKPAPFLDRVHLRACVLLLEPGCPVQEPLFPKSLRRLGIAPAHLLDHHVKILVHINPKSAHRTDPSFGGLDRSSAPIKLEAGFLV
jgi:hypothetical protein